MSQPVKITGSVLIGGTQEPGHGTFAALNPATGERISPDFQEAHAGQVAKACELAAAAFGAFSELSPGLRAQFLHSVAQEILGLGDVLIERAMAETGLPRARLEG